MPAPSHPLVAARPVRQGARLLDQVRDRIRYRHYSIRTEHAYVQWVRRFVIFNRYRHPRDMGAAEVSQFLTHLAVKSHVAAATQNQAKSALLFLYREVLDMSLPWLDDVEGAKRPQRLPTVLTPAETDALLSCVSGITGLVVQLLYGSGMRLMEAVRLRVKDVDFARREILVREGKGVKDRVTMLPDVLTEPLQAHLGWVHATHKADLARGLGEVYLPFALAQELLGHKDVSTTMIYTHVLNKGGRGATSPLDARRGAPARAVRRRPARNPDRASADVRDRPEPS